MKEHELVQLIISGDESSASKLINTYGPMIRYIIFPILSDEREREECFSDVILRIIEKIGTYSEEKGNLKSWISVLARNAALNRARRLCREPDTQSIDSDLPSLGDNPEEEIVKNELLQRLEEIVGSFSEKDKIIFYRKFYYCQPSGQIAAEMGMTLRAAEGRIYRIKRTIKKELGGDDCE